MNAYIFLAYLYINCKIGINVVNINKNLFGIMSIIIDHISEIKDALKFLNSLNSFISRVIVLFICIYV